MGDGFMAWFPSATRAVECAIGLQRAFEERNRGVGAGLAHSDNAAISEEAEPAPTGGRREGIRVRIGINAGEPIAEGDDLFGASVIATARITAQATGGQILASDVVRQLLAGKGFTFEDRGEAALKGFDEPGAPLRGALAGGRVISNVVGDLQIATSPLSRARERGRG
jgi:class 3 adenylate cyclase